MALPGVENVGAPWESIFNLSRGPQLPYKNNNFKNKFEPNLFNKSPRFNMLRRFNMPLTPIHLRGEYVFWN